MKKLTSIFLFGLLLISTSSVMAQDQTVKQNNSQYTVSDDYNFENNSYNISDEQLQDTSDINKIEDNATFWQKLINSSHFSSNTATRTYIPINKAQD